MRLAPDIVAEVPSPSQYRAEITAKMRLWLAGGVRLAWVVWTRTETVEVWRPDQLEVPGPPGARTLGMEDQLDGLDVLPGFAYPVAELFARD